MFPKSLSFEDVLLKPQFSTIKSRSDVSTKVTLGSFTFSNPMIPANMRDVIDLKVAKVLYEQKMLGLMHRFAPSNTQLEWADEIGSWGKDVFNYIGFSVGVKDHDKEIIPELIGKGVKIFCIDIAHGHSQLCLDMIKHIRSTFPKVFIIAGNVASGSGAKALWDMGADVVKVGVGSSKICSTRLETGNGNGQLSAIMEVATLLKNLRLQKPEMYDYKYLISDGGIKDAGSIVKACVFADMVMMGGMFSGLDESPGAVIEINGKQFKEYHGSSTHKSSPDGVNKNHVEGVMALSTMKHRSVAEQVRILMEGFRSGCAYQNAHNTRELKECVGSFMEISAATLAESQTHKVIE